MEDLSTLLDVARQVAWAGGRRTLAYWRNPAVLAGNVDTKSDGTPVTIADREAETIMRQVIEDRFPDHGILGEEHGTKEGTVPIRWILDPIDGTKTFVAGVPLYGTLVGVEVEGEAKVGAIYMPGLDEMVSAAVGHGCFVNGRRCSVSSTHDLSQALVCCTDERHSRNRGDGGWANLQSQVRITRGWGDCYGYVLVATGRADVMVDPAMASWDCAALLPIIEEAGGRFTTWEGERTIHGADAFATNGILHERVLEALGCASSGEDGP